MTKMDGFEIKIEQRLRKEECMEIPIQIFYVVSGKARMETRGRKYEMGQEDLILVNGMEPFSVISQGDSVVCILSIDYALISRLTSDSVLIFSLNSLEIPNRPYGDIREIFRELVYFELLGEGELRCRKMSRIYELLDILFLHCCGQAMKKEGKDGSTLSDSDKLQHILAYVNGHFRDSFSLRELAGSMYTSTSTLSRLFKKQTGHYFGEYLNRVRLAHAVMEISDTTRSITRIAMDCGFSSPSAFSSLFHNVYGMTPQEYRKDQLEKALQHKEGEEELKQDLRDRLEKLHPRNRQDGGNTVIEVMALEGKPFTNPWNIVLNMSSLSALTRANVQFHLLNLVKELHMNYVKIWSVFAKDLRITDGKTLGAYNYSMVDTVLDVLVENQIAVYFDFGSRTDVIIGSSDNTLMSEEVGIDFAGREYWEDLFEDFIRHLISRYGKKEISRWVFDFCIDPTFRGHGHYYTDPEYDYQNVFDFAWHTIRRLVPGARVGGPVGITNSSGKEIETFLTRCMESGICPDFVSVPLFPYQPNLEGDRFAHNPDPEFELRQLRMLKETILRICGKDVPIYISDWNLSVSNRNVLNDSCMRGTYLCSRAYGIMEYASLCSIWIASDWISNYFDTRSILSGCGGILTRDNIRKPAYYALQFLGKLQGTVLCREPHMIVTMENLQSFRVLCANQTSFHVGYYLKREEEITPENMDLSVSSDPARVFVLEISGLPEDVEYVIRTRSVNRHYGSIQDEWKRFGYDERLAREDVKYLREICVPHLSMSRLKVRNGKLSCRILLDEQEFQLIHIFQADADK